MKLARQHFLRGVVTYALLAAVVVGTTLTLSQCTMVGNNVTGVRLTASERGECLQQCAQDFADKIAAEAKRHAEELQRCSSLADSDRQSCIDAENTLFQQDLRELNDGLLACKNGCHQQGAGDAG
jgi:hypothetical protein